MPHWLKPNLRFALLWPQPSNGDSPAVRLNLICDGKLLEPVTLHAYNVEEVIEPALESLRKLDSSRPKAVTLNLMAVPQIQLDLLLAIRRWFHESDAIPKIPIPEPKTGIPDWEGLKIRLMNEANSLLSAQTPAAEKNGSAT
jgi:hypothetical protein